MNNFEKTILANQNIAAILERAGTLNMPNWYLGAGCISQTAWNIAHTFNPEDHIKDYDLVYFDPQNLSYDDENQYIEKSKKLFSDLDADIEIRNQARVHLWYKDHFGFDIRPYTSAEDAISTWPTNVTSIGVTKNADESLKFYAPFGIDDITSMTVRANKKLITKEIYENKVGRWQKVWPKLNIIPWKLA